MAKGKYDPEERKKQAENSKRRQQIKMAPSYCFSKALTPNLKMSHPQQPTTTDIGIYNGAIVTREEQANTTIAASLSHYGTPGIIYITEKISIYI